MQAPIPIIIGLAFVALPLLEIAALIKAGQMLGLWPVVLIIVLTGLGGAQIMRTQGVATFRRMSDTLAEGREPHATLADGALLLLSGVLLLLPGLITDSVGLLLLLPPIRALAVRFVVGASATSGRRSGQPTGDRGRPAGTRTGARSDPRPDPSAPADNQIIEGEFERLEERPIEPTRRPRPEPGKDP